MLGFLILGLLILAYCDSKNEKPQKIKKWIDLTEEEKGERMTRASMLTSIYPLVKEGYIAFKRD